MNAKEIDADENVELTVDELKQLVSHLEELEKREGYIPESAVFGSGKTGGSVVD